MARSANKIMWRRESEGPMREPGNRLHLWLLYSPSSENILKLKEERPSSRKVFPFVEEVR